MTHQMIHGACPHDCPDTCGVITEVADGRAVNFYGDPDHPITQGWLCAKVRPYLKHVYHPDRLRHPLRRAGSKGSGHWQRISWDEAIAEIANQWAAIIDRYGAEAILPYSYSGTLGLVQMTVASARLWNRLGASRLERSICCAAAITAVESTLGVRWAPAYDSLPESKLIIVWGHNPVTTAPHVMPHLKKAQRQGTRLIVIDPRRTRTAQGADWHIAPLPGTDGALALGLSHIIVREGWHDEAWLTANTVGWPQLQQRLPDYPPDRVADITGLPVETITELARQYATTKPSLIKFSDGVQRNFNGGQAVRAICCLPALTGQYGQAGGGLAYSSSGLYRWDSQAINHWQDCPQTSPRKVNMNRLGAALLGEVNDPPLKSLYVFGANPVASSPNARAIIEGLKRDDLFTVVHEQFMTDTADYADIVLPATSQLEQADLNTAYGHPTLTYNHQAIAPLGESKSNWEVMRLLAQAMGYTDTWLHQSVDEVLTEIINASNHQPHLAGLTLDRLKAESSIPLKLPQAVPFADLSFPTASGKVELYSEAMLHLGYDPLPVYTAKVDDVDSGVDLADADALNLVSGAAHHFVSSSLANHPEFVRREGEPFLEIHPSDAAKRAIQSGDIVKVVNGRGWCRLKAVISEAIRPGVVATPKGFWPKNHPWKNGDGGRNINWLTSDALADVAGQSTYHSTRVWLTPDIEIGETDPN